LLWFTKGARLPPLATANSVPLALSGVVPPAASGLTDNITSTFNQTAVPALGTPNTFVVIGNNEVDDQARSGGRLTAGFWLDPDKTFGIEVSGFYLSPHSSHFSANSNDFPTLAEPFSNPGVLSVLAAPGTPTSPTPRVVPFLSKGKQNRPVQLKSTTIEFEDVYTIGSSTLFTQLATNPMTSAVNATGIFAQKDFGRIDVSTSNRFWGAEANGRANLAGSSSYRVDFLGGFRYLQLKDELQISSSHGTVISNMNDDPTNQFLQPLPATFSGVTFQGNQFPNGTVFVSDSFDTRNEFYGGQIGTEIDFQRGRWVVDLTGKVALGVMHQHADITGFTQLLTPGNITTYSGGLYAASTNSGSHNRDVLGVVPELGINVGYQVTPRLRATVGYSFLFTLGDVIRAGDQINRSVNPNLVHALFNPFFNPVTGLSTLPPNTTAFGSGSPAQPAFTFKDTSYWAQGLAAGLEFSF
jgi:hypothetical protein